MSFFSFNGTAIIRNKRELRNSKNHYVDVDVDHKQNVDVDVDVDHKEKNYEKWQSASHE